MPEPLPTAELAALPRAFSSHAAHTFALPIPCPVAMLAIEAAEDYCRDTTGLCDMGWCDERKEAWGKGREAYKAYMEEEWATIAAACGEFLEPLRLERWGGKPDVETLALQARVALWCISHLDWGEDQLSDILVEGLHSAALGKGWDAPVHIGRKIEMMGEEGIYSETTDRGQEVLRDIEALRAAETVSVKPRQVIIVDPVLAASGLTSSPPDKRERQAREDIKGAVNFLNSDDPQVLLYPIAQGTLWYLYEDCYSLEAKTRVAQEFIKGFDAQVRDAIAIELSQGSPRLSATDDLSSVSGDARPSLGPDLGD